MGLRRWRGDALERFDPAQSARSRELAGALLASFPRRAAAFALDFALGLVPFVGLFLLFVNFAEQHGWLNEGAPLLHFFEHEHMVEVSGRGDTRNLNFRLGFLQNLVGLVWWVLFFGLSLYWCKGRTLGKRLFGLRVVSLEHEHLSFWHCIERALAYGASALEAGFGFLQYYLDENRQTVHDRIAKTIVVREPRKKREKGRASAKA